MEAGWKNCLYSGTVHYTRFIPALLSKVIGLYIPNVLGLLKGQKMKTTKNLNVWLVMSMFLLAMACATAAGGTIYVDADGPADFNTIQAAIDDSNDGDTIIVGPGIYTGDGNRDINFNRKAITLRSTDPNDPNIVATTIIDCNGTETEPHRGFYFYNGEDANSVLEGFTITKGYGPEEQLYDPAQPFPLSVGGGIFFEQSSPTISKCVITGNTAGTGCRIMDFFGVGGGIACNQANPVITRCTITNNWSCYGGGIYGGYYYFGPNKSSPIINNCTISGNWSCEGGGICGCDGPIIDCNISGNIGEHPRGGGLAFCDGNIINCRITGNWAKYSGGGLYECGGVIIDCNITDNSTGGGGGPYSCGGGIACKDACPAITNCTITGNYARYGGGIFGCDGPITGCTISHNSNSGLSGCGGPITNCTISDNTSGLTGGGLEVCAGTIRNCVIRNNTADQYGGGLYACNGSITNCTITGNRVLAEGNTILGSFGGGLCQSNGNINNCIISGNSAGGDGGGLSFCDGLITNCIINGNLAQYNGGGLSYCSNVINCTISGNLAGGYGGGICDLYGQAINCIIWGNSAPTGDEIAIMHGLETEVTYCDVQGGKERVYVDPSSTLNWEAGNIDVNPEFIDPNNEDFHLKLGSFCIDAGTNDPNGGLAANDIEGNNRLIDGDNDGIAVVDMGVYESLPANEPVIGLSQWEIRFLAPEGGPNPQSQTIGIRNMGTGTVNWTIGYDCGWLDVSPTAGSSTGQWDEVTLTTDVAGIEAGVYESELAILATGVINSPRMVGVIMVVSADVVHVPSQFPTIQHGIDYVQDGGIVVVADGTYVGQGNRDIDFRGKAITVRSANGPENCIIDCQGTETEPHRGFVFYSGEDASSVLDGFTITNGNTHPELILRSGCGIWCRNGSPTITNCRIINNTAGLLGGGISGAGLGKNNKPIISDCTIANNKTEEGQYEIGCSGITNCDGPITDCNITGNSGSGISNCSASITNCIITGNSKGASRCSGIIANCTIAGNSGSGISNCSALIANCTITGNSDSGIYCYESSPAITNCTISGNSAEYSGGAIRCWISSPTITNCTITGNTAQLYGGAINCRFGSSPTITNCTITGNSAQYPGGAIYCRESSNPTVANSIIWANSLEQIYVTSNCSPSITYSNVQDSWPGQDNIATDPCFVCPGCWADANDPNIIVEPDDPNAVWIDGDYHLLADSPCIDAGDPNYIAEPNETDLDGKPRVIGGRIDMGAFEYSPSVWAEVRIVPRTINLTSKGKWITCHIWLSEDYEVADIDPNSVFLEYEVGVESFRVDQEQQVAIAKFSRSGVQDILNVGQVGLTVNGKLINGTVFEGTDVIRVIDKGRRK